MLSKEDIAPDTDKIMELVWSTPSQEGFQVSHYATGDEALELLQSEVPDLVLISLTFQGTDGPELGKRLKDYFNVKKLRLWCLHQRVEKERKEGHQ
jgi:DNA-binding response OmpR family regulator